MSMGRGRLGRRPRPVLLLWSTQARQQASRPDKAWARRALTDQYATRFVARRSRSALQVRCKTLSGVCSRTDQRSAIMAQCRSPQAHSTRLAAARKACLPGRVTKLPAWWLQSGPSCRYYPISARSRELCCGAPAPHPASRVSLAAEVMGRTGARTRPISTAITRWDTRHDFRYGTLAPPPETIHYLRLRRYHAHEHRPPQLSLMRSVRTCAHPVCGPCALHVRGVPQPGVRTKSHPTLDMS
jgi:hypothetical protein